ncbi:hypothetical protein ACU686_12715 [Yinghuangia aomiensis]
MIPIPAREVIHAPQPSPPYLVSKLRPQDINMRDGERRTIRCPECRTWRMIRRGMVWTHHPDGERCSGSARKVVFDLTVEQWELKLQRQARRCADAMPAENRRSATQFSKPTPPVAPAVTQMRNCPPAQPTKSKREQWTAVNPSVKRVDRERERLRKLAEAQAKDTNTDVPVEPPRIAV